MTAAEIAELLHVSKSTSRTGRGAASFHPRKLGGAEIEALLLEDHAGSAA
jgi:hypothetical protein